MEQIIQALMYSKPNANTPEAIQRHAEALEMAKEIHEVLKQVFAEADTLKAALKGIGHG